MKNEKNKEEKFALFILQFAFCNSRRAGFTLIEVLIAVAIISIVIAALYGTFFMSQKAIGAVDDSLVRLQECRGIVDIIKREIESSFYSKDKSYSVFKIDDRDYFGRQTSHLSLTAFSILMPGLSKISYIIEEDGEKLILAKEIESAYFQSDNTKNIELIGDIDSFTVEAKFKDKWVKTWDAELTKNIPDEIRISLSVRIGEDQKQVSVSDIARPKIGNYYE